MKRSLFVVVVIIGITIFVPVLHAAESQPCAIHWLYPDQPPLFIAKGYGAGMGTGEQTMKFFSRQLKGCTHRFDGANYERIITTIRQSEAACCVSLYPTPERERFIEFTVPVRVTLANSLIILADQRNRFKPFMDGKKHVYLEKLIQSGFKIGVAKGRVYQGIIDEILKKYNDDPRIVEHPSSENMVGKMIQMMVAGRIDALIGYPFEAQYVAMAMKEKIKIISIHIAGMDEYLVSYAGCSKTEKGKAVVKQLNTIILKHRTTPAFMEYAEHWFDPESIKRFRKYTAKEFGKR